MSNAQYSMKQPLPMILLALVALQLSSRVCLPCH